MHWFEKILGKQNSKEEEDKFKHAVIVRFKYGKEDLEPLHNLEEKLRKILVSGEVGELDGHEIALDLTDGFLYFYGYNAEDLYKCVEPVLCDTDFMKGAIATLRFGPPEDDVSEIKVRIESE